MAQKEGFEPSRRFTQPTPLAGEPLRPLGYFCKTYKYKNMAEREGFEPPVPLGITGFQDQRHKPLGHLSSLLEPADLLYDSLLTLSTPFFEQKRCGTKSSTTCEGTEYRSFGNSEGAGRIPSLICAGPAMHSFPQGAGFPAPRAAGAPYPTAILPFGARR